MDSNPNHLFKFHIILIFFLAIFTILVQSSANLSPSPSPSSSPSSSPLQSPPSSYINSPPDAEIESPTDEPPSIDRPTDEPPSIESPTSEPPSTESPTDEPPSTGPTETGPLSSAKPPSMSFPSLSNLTKVDPVVEKICEKTDYPALCISSISPLFNGRGDPISILELTIRACADYTKLATGVAKGLAVLPDTSQQTASVLGDCTDFLDDALDNLENAKKAIATKDIGTINSMLSAAISDYVTCEDEFEGENSPLAAYDDKLSNMASNCLAIASLI